MQKFLLNPLWGISTIRMCQRFLQKFGLIAIILSHLVGATPFEDDKGNPAPVPVRRATDAVLNAFSVLQSHKAAQVKYPLDHASCSYKCYLYCCGMPCICPDHMSYPYARDTPKPPVKVTEWYWYRNDNGASRSRAEAEMASRINVLKYEVNAGVSRQIAYEGDMDLNVTWNMWSDGMYRLNEDIQTTVMKWVNSHGGWREPANTSIVVTSFDSLNPILG